jgi:hypothetical protein
LLRRVLSFLGIYVVCSAVATFFLLLNWFPYHPHSLSGWLVFFVVAVPVTVVGEGIAKFVFFSNPVARAIDAKTEGRSFSWLRISFMLITMLLFSALVLVILHRLGLLHHGWPAP